MSQRLVHTMVALAFASGLTVLALAVAVPGNSAAETHPIIVSGYVYDIEGNLVDDIPITVNMKDGETVISTESATSGGDGSYSAFFDSADWAVGYTVPISAAGP